MGCDICITKQEYFTILNWVTSLANNQQKGHSFLPKNFFHKLLVTYM